MRFFSLAPACVSLGAQGIPPMAGRELGRGRRAGDVCLDGIHLWTSHLTNPIPNLAQETDLTLPNEMLMQEQSPVTSAL